MSFFYLTFVFLLLISAYLGWRFRWAFGAFFPKPLQKVWLYWGLFVFVIAIFPFLYFRVGRDTELIGQSSSLLWSAAVLFGTIVFSFTITLLIDCVCFLIRHLPGIKTLARPATDFFHRRPYLMGLLVMVVICGYVTIGLQRADTPQETWYQISIDKPLAAPGNRLRIVHLSDTHISAFASKEKYEALVSRINALQPDLVVLTGDIVDRSIRPFYPLSDTFRKLKPRYGVFAVLGNHEYYGESPSLAAKAYSDAGMIVLRDKSYYLPAPGITLVGRNDRTQGSSRMVNNPDPSARLPRAELSELMTGVDQTHPVILLDHQPYDLELAQSAGVDIEFSGHTHNGQFFPLNFLVAAIFENPWGLLRKGAYTSIVSCGFGTWGPPLRLPSFSEVVVVDVGGKQQ